MAKLFADIPQALENTLEIARRCNLAIELGKSRLPAFPTPAGVSVEDYLRQQAAAGLEKDTRKSNPITASAWNSNCARSSRWASRATS